MRPRVYVVSASSSFADSFGSLGLLSPVGCRPFDADRDGISIGEGAGMVLLEKVAAGKSRDSIALLGVGESSDAYHMSTPHPEGLGARMAMEQALLSAGLPPAAVDYINLHGTGTRSNDATEDKAVCAVFGNETPCSSTKGWTGHTLGACGAMEAWLGIEMMREGWFCPTANLENVDPRCGTLDYVMGAPRRLDVEYLMSNNFAFGGINTAMILRRLG